MNSSIVKQADGRYRARVNYQSDREVCVFSTEDEARRWCRDAERQVNGNREVRKRDILLYAERLETQVVTWLEKVTR